MGQHMPLSLLYLFCYTIDAEQLQIIMLCLELPGFTGVNMKYSFLLIFILAHLLGDFALQTDKITKIKSTSLKGVAIHAGLIVMVQALFLSIFGLQGALLGAACGIIHFFIDYVKEMIGKTLNVRFFYFIFDQMMHFSVIILFTLLFTPSYVLLPLNILYVKIAIIIIVLVFASNITAKMLIRDLNVNIRKDTFFKKRERLIDAIVCSAVFSSMLLPLSVFLFPIAFVFYLYSRFMKFKFEYSFDISAIKYFVYIFISFAMLLFLKLG